MHVRTRFGGIFGGFTYVWQGTVAGTIAGLINGTSPNADAHAMCHIAAYNNADQQHPNAEREDQPARLGTLVHLVQILLQLQRAQYEHWHCNHGHQQIDNRSLIAWATRTAAQWTTQAQGLPTMMRAKVLAAVVWRQCGAGHHRIGIL